MAGEDERDEEGVKNAESRATCAVEVAVGNGGVSISMDVAEVDGEGEWYDGGGKGGVPAEMGVEEGGGMTI